MPNPEDYDSNPRDYALALVEDDGITDYETLAVACLKFMSQSEVHEMLDLNELSPRFLDDEDDEDDEDEA